MCYVTELYYGGGRVGGGGQGGGHSQGSRIIGNSSDAWTEECISGYVLRNANWETKQKKGYKKTGEEFSRHVASL